ncbi:MAG: quinone oxidoreductase [Gammaproteobacteria bacterium]|nr:quinone oxidoreductase [Gammaproteobacteria bacterium]
MVVHRYGGPDVLRWEEIAVEAPGPGQALVDNAAIGMNLSEIGFRSGTFHAHEFDAPKPPFVLGVESVGTVRAVGPGVTEVAVGERVGCPGLPNGAYAGCRVYPADRLVPVPADIADEVAAAVMVKGMTAQYLCRRTCPVGPGTTLLIHAAAGATGQFVCELADHLGATVIGTVSSDAKAEYARAHGCHHPIVYTRENFADRVLQITAGRGADVIYDSVGRDTFADSLRCLSRFGTLGLFGVSSGLPEPLQLMGLHLLTEQKFCRPSFYAQTAQRQDLLAIAAHTFDDLRRGVFRPHIDLRLPLRDAAAGHRAVEARRTTGAVVYLP